jgi:type II secretory pathway pseudopilin PulG
MKHKKYTLIELLISMGIFAVMMLLLLNFFSRYQDFTYRAGLRNERIADVQTFFAQIERDLKCIYGLRADAGGLTPGIKLTSESILFYSRSTLKDEESNGIGGLAKLQYQKVGSNIYRDFTQMTDGTLADLASSLTPKIINPSSIDPLTTKKIISGVRPGFTVSYYSKKDEFLSGTPPTSLPTGAITEIYALRISIDLEDPNPSMSQTEKNRNSLSFSKTIILNIVE